MNFVYVEKRVKMQGAKKLTALSWNGNLDQIIVAGEEGFLRVLQIGTLKKELNLEKLENVDSFALARKSCTVTLSYTLSSHVDSGKIVNVCWNSIYSKVTSFDDSGKIVVFLYWKDSSWYEEMINNRKKSVVTNVLWSSDGKKIVITYTDGLCIVGTLEGTRVWTKRFTFGIKKIAWSPDDESLLVLSLDDKVYDVEAKWGNVVKELKIRRQGKTITDIQVYSPFFFKYVRSIQNIKIQSAVHSGKGPPSFAASDTLKRNIIIVLDGGILEIFGDESVRSSISVATHLVEVTSCRWNNEGSVFAVAGVVDRKTKENVVQFYDNSGMYLTTLHVDHIHHLGEGGSGNNKISGISWDRHGFRLAFIIGSDMFISMVRISYLKCRRYLKALVANRNFCDLEIQTALVTSPLSELTEG